MAVITPSSADNFLQSGAPTTNNGTSASIYCGDDSGGSDKIRGLIKFDLSSIPSGSVVSAVTLSLYETVAGGSSTPYNVNLHRVLRDWSESQSTWNVYTTGNNWGTAGCANTTSDRSSSSSAVLALDATAASAYVDWSGATLTDDVQKMVNGTYTNYGWVIVSDGEGTTPKSYNAFSSNNAASNKPKLTVTYTASGGAFLLNFI